MTLRLILIRHAKSSWDEPAQDDHDRPLNDRGRASADAIGAWLSAKGYVPDQVQCSDAARTVETWGRIAKVLQPTPTVSYRPSLYHASASAMLDVLRRSTGRVVAMIGHNPGIGSFACGIVGQRPDHPRYFDYPTCATAVIDFDADTWANLAPGSGRVVDFTVPRDLIGGDGD